MMPAVPNRSLGRMSSPRPFLIVATVVATAVGVILACTAPAGASTGCTGRPGITVT